MTLDIHNREGLNARDQKVLANIEEYGWHVVTVGRTSDDEEGPDWAYSCGMQITLKHPEIVIFGLDLDDSHQIINGIGAQIQGGQRFEDGKKYSGIVADYNCVFKAIQESHYRKYFGVDRWLYEDDPWSILQCFWPNSSGKYPWDRGVKGWVREGQPLLYEAREKPKRRRVGKVNGRV
jgi:hypothetical protein